MNEVNPIYIPRNHRVGCPTGTRFATEVFEHLETANHEITLSCTFLRRVGATRDNWRNKFNLGVKKSPKSRQLSLT